MANVANCKKCGMLFLQTSNKRDVCDKCFEEQNKLLSEINAYVTMYPEEHISLDEVLKKFGLTIDEFEAFYVAGKFVKSTLTKRFRGISLISYALKPEKDRKGHPLIFL